MTSRSPGPLLLTGASGTVGAALWRALASTWPGDALAIGRTPPPPGGPRLARFTPVDLADPNAVTAFAAHIAAGPPVSALVCAAGLDARAHLGEFTSASAAECVQVNAWAHVELLRAALTSHSGDPSPTPPRTPTPAPATRPTTTPPGTLPVVLISSDVVGAVLPGTLVYAAAKAAAEEAFRHAAADSVFGAATEPGTGSSCDEPTPAGIDLLIVQLPDIGVPMRAVATGPPPPRGDTPPRPVLTAAINQITSFLATGHKTRMETRNA